MIKIIIVFAARVRDRPWSIKIPRTRRGIFFLSDRGCRGQLLLSIDDRRRMCQWKIDGRDLHIKS